jgi:hypothetical protein
MDTFHALGKSNLTILVSNFGVDQVVENIFCVKFVFWHGFLHVFKDFFCDDNIVFSYIYQVSDVNFEWMFWMATNGRYWIVGKHALNNSHDIILKHGTTALVANVVVKGVVMKEEPNPVSQDSKFFVPMVKSSFINLCNSSNEDGPSHPNVVIPLYVNSWLAEEQLLHLDVS